MSKDTKQRTTTSDVNDGAPDDGNAPGKLTDTRAEMDRLFAVAAKSFEAMSEGNSQEFLKSSRQTGGQ